MPAEPVIDAEIARKVLDRDIVNLINRAKEGRPLTPGQRRTIAEYAGLLDKQEVLSALDDVRGLVCRSCAEVITRLIVNVQNA